MSMADKFRTMGVRTNADTPADAKKNVDAILTFLRSDAAAAAQ